MTCCVFGPGLVGSFLGAAAGSTLAIPGPSGAVRATRILLAGRELTWHPRLTRLDQLGAELASGLPLLVTSRVHQTPWSRLPADARAAQNGLGQPRAVVTCFFAIDRAPDGVLSATGPSPRVVVSAPDRSWSPVFAAWQAHGLEVEVCGDPRPAQWEKTVLNATVGPLCLATGLSMGAVWADDRLCRLVLDATAEGDALARACGVACPPGMVARAQAFFSQVGSHRPSLLADHGELPWVLGSLIASARQRAFPVPHLQRIADLVAAHLGRALAEPA
jgi:hypothetical protein